MAQARELGFSYGDPAWSNLGQGAPETDAIAGGPERLSAVHVNPTLCEYAPVAGDLELREAVANLYNARYRVGRASQYSAENVAIAGGGRLSLSRLAAALGRTHLGHLLPDYTAYEELLDIFALFTPIPIPLEAATGYQLSAKQVRNEIVQRGLGALLFSNPSNPTGRVVQGEALDEWVTTARELDSYLLIDEFYAHYIWDGNAKTVSAAAYVDDVNVDPVVMLDGLTKNWRYPGWRVGWTVGPKTVIEAVSSVGSFLDGGAPHPLQRAAIPLLDPAVADAEAEAIRATFGPKRELMLAGLRKIGVHIDNEPGGAFYVWGDVSGLPDGLNTGRSFFREALKQRVIVVPGEFFDVNPGNRRHHRESRFSRHVRFSFGPEIGAVRSGLERLHEMVQAAR